MGLFGIATDALQEKMKSAISQYYQECMDKKKIGELLDDLCLGKEGQTLLDNQGFAGGIDFYALTNTLRTELIDNVLFYYNEMDRKKASEEKDRFCEQVQVRTGAVTVEQKRAVSHFLDHIYIMTGSYMLKCLDKEDMIAAILGREYTDRQIAVLREEICKLLEMLKKPMNAEVWEYPIGGFRAYHQRQKNYNGAYRLLSISDKLFPALSAWDGVQYLNEKGTFLPLYACLCNDWKLNEIRHLLLIGGGGMGKTVSLLRLWDKLLEDGICTIYIPLHEIMSVVPDGRLSEDVIKKYITDSVWHGNEQKLRQFLEHLSEFDHRPALVLLLDGFNEVPGGNRRAAMNLIKEWMNCTGVQIIISSRYDFRKNITVEKLRELKIELLSDEQVREWFALCGMTVPDKNAQLYNLLKTPFMLTLYTQVEKRYNQGKEANFIKWMEPSDTSSHLMWNFMQCQILKMANDHLKPDEDILKATIATSYILPYICWIMEWKELFAVEVGELKHWIEEIICLYRNKWESCPDPWVEFWEIEYGNIQWDVNNFLDILIKELELLVNHGERTYSLLHQNFRDFLAAVHLYRVVNSNIEEALAETWESRPFSDNVVIFLAEWMSEEAADAMFHSLRGKQISEGNYIFFNLMRVIRKIKRDDLSGMDFSDMDLRSVVLNGACLVNGVQRAVFRNARINYSTLVMQGHWDKIYYVAFSEDGRQLLSISAHEIRIWDIRTGSCIHEIADGPTEINGCLEYNDSKFYKTFVAADGKEFTWIGENDTCLKEISYYYAELAQCSENWKKRNNNPYAEPTMPDLEELLQYKRDMETVEVQGDGIAVRLPTGEKRTLTGNQAMATCANLSKDMKYCVAGMEDGSICIWSLESSRITKVFPSSTGRICFAGGFGTFYIGQTSGIVMIWKEPYKICSHVLEGRKSPVTLITISEAKNLCIVSHEDNVAEIWDLSENCIIETMADYEYVSITENGNFLCVKTLEGSVWCKNLETGEIDYDIWTDVEKNTVVACDWNMLYIFQPGTMNYVEAAYIPDKKEKGIIYGGCIRDRNYPIIKYCHNLVHLSYFYGKKPYNIYTILNMNLFGCDFTGAVFETLELAAKVQSNGGILELPEEYHKRLHPHPWENIPKWTC